MALRPAPTLVSATQLQLPMTGPLFEPLTAGILLDHATEGDGFEDHFATAMQHLADDGSVGDSLDEHLTAVEFRPGEFGATNYGPIALDTAAFLDSGDQQIGGLEGDIHAVGTGPGGAPATPDPPAPQTPPPTAPSSGGGGYLYAPADGDPLGLGRSTQ